VFAQGVELGKLKDQQRAVPFPTTGQELTVGRTAQPVTMWDMLVPDRRLHGTVSREHFKVILQANNGPEQPLVFNLLCLSLNGLLLNGEFLRQGSGERRLQHGDRITLAASAEHTVVERGGPPPARKPFVGFVFEVSGAPPPITSAANQPAEAAAQREASPAAKPKPPVEGRATIAASASGARAGSPATSSSPAKSPTPEVAPPSEEEVELQRPAEGTVAGRWRSSEAGNYSLPEDAVFCLEVHGDHVRMDLPSEARQLFFCCERDTAVMPALRVGRHYQKAFWKRVLRPGVLESTSWSSSVSADHFEVRTAWRSNPYTREPPDWRFRLKVLGSAGVVVNYGIVCTCGDERELHPSDTLTLDFPSADSTRTGNGMPQGLNFTFIPYKGALAVAPQDGPPKLPDLDLAFDDETDSGGPIIEKSSAATHEQEQARLARSSSASSKAASLPSNGRAGALRPPTDWATESADGGTTPPGAASVATPQPGLTSGSTQREASVKTQHYLNIEDEGLGDPDDLFAKTGFKPSSRDACDVDQTLPASGIVRGLATVPKKEAAAEQGPWYGSWTKFSF